MSHKLLKNLIFIIVIISAIALFFGFGKLKTKEEYYNNSLDGKKPIGKISFSVECNTIKDEAEDNIYKSGILFQDKSLTIYENETVYDVMVRLQKDKKITMDAEYSELYNSSYVKGLFGLYEFDYGDLSGWIYHVGDIEPSVGCSEWTVKDGDVVRWLYTKDLGRDLK